MQPREPFGGKGDHDGDGKVGGVAPLVPSRVPVLTDEEQERINMAANSVNEPVREKTLHELNLEARAIDRYHYNKRMEAQRVARETIEPMLRGVQRPRQVTRRMQKSLRIPVTK